MITQEIKKVASPFVSRLIDTLVGRPPEQPPPALPAPSKDNVVPLHKTWDKITYARWIEGVKKVFRVGDFVTHNRNPIWDNYCPVSFKVVAIQELYYEVGMDLTRNKPKALFLRLNDGNGSTWNVPDDFRLLTANEIAYANLRNK